MAHVLDKLDLELKEEKKIDRLISKVEVTNEIKEPHAKKSRRDNPSSSNKKRKASLDNNRFQVTPKEKFTPEGNLHIFQK